MNDWLGPSATTPRTTEEQYSRARMIGSPPAKVIKFVGIASLSMIGLIIAFVGNMLYETMKYGPNGKQKRR